MTVVLKIASSDVSFTLNSVLYSPSQVWYYRDKKNKLMAKMFYGSCKTICERKKSDFKVKHQILILIVWISKG